MASKDELKELTRKKDALHDEIDDLRQQNAWLRRDLADVEDFVKRQPQSTIEDWKRYKSEYDSLYGPMDRRFRSDYSKYRSSKVEELWEEIWQLRRWRLVSLLQVRTHDSQVLDQSGEQARYYNSLLSDTRQKLKDCEEQAIKDREEKARLRHDIHELGKEVQEGERKLEAYRDEVTLAVDDTRDWMNSRLSQMESQCRTKISQMESECRRKLAMSEAARRKGNKTGRRHSI